MAGRRISIGLHDGAKMVARQPIDRKLSNKNLLDVTKDAFDTRTSQHSLGELVQEIGGVKANKDAGFQVYLALEKAGKVMQVGLPCVSDKGGEKHFLDATNMKAGDVDSMLGHLPEDVELMVVWRLDSGMTQDIVVTENSIMAPMDQSVDYSALDKKPCLGCGGGIDEKLNLVFDILQVEIFGGEKDDPIRMSTMMAAPPTSHGWDVIPIEPQWIQQPPLNNPPVDKMEHNRSRVEQTDFTLRTSWTDSIELSEAPQPITQPLVEDASKPVEKKKPQLIMLIVYSEKRADPLPSKCEPPAHFRPSEKKLWSQIYSAPTKSAPIAKPNQPTIPMTKSLPKARIPPTTRKQLAQKKAPEAKKIEEPKATIQIKKKKEPKKKAKPKPKVLLKPKKKKRLPKLLKRKKAKPKRLPKKKAKPRPKPKLRSIKKTLTKKKLAPETISKKKKRLKPKVKSTRTKKRIRDKLKKAAKRTRTKALLKKRAKKISKKKSHYVKELMAPFY